jgi:thioesterase domain-containing protein
MPGVGGNVLMFAQLSKLLGDDQPFYGLQARGLDDTSEPFDSMPEMAEHYVEEIRSVQTRGPYVVIGACTGGVIAYEVAQQLTRRGEPVVLLLLETWHPLSARPTLSMKILWPFRSVWSKVSVHAQALARVPMRAWPQFLWRKARNAGRAAVAAVTGDHAGRDSSPQYVRATWRAVSNYSPEPYPGKLLNVIAKGRKLHSRTVDTRHMWEMHARASETIFMTARDSGLLFVSPHVEELAGHIKRYVIGELAHMMPPGDESARRGDMAAPIRQVAARR